MAAEDRDMTLEPAAGEIWRLLDLIAPDVRAVAEAELRAEGIGPDEPEGPSAPDRPDGPGLSDGASGRARLFGQAGRSESDGSGESDLSDGASGRSRLFGRVGQARGGESGGLDLSDGPSGRAESWTGDVAARLRAAATVTACEAVLTATPDWDLLADEHRREPFGRAQRRALVARQDCPDTLLRDLLTPWDSLVAGRLRLAHRPVPDWMRPVLLSHIGDVHAELVRRLVTLDTVEDVIAGVARLDLLVRAMDGSGGTGRTWLFWQAAGHLLWRHSNADIGAWLAAAARFPAHPGTLASLLRRVRRDPVPPPVQAVDLRLLAHAPDQPLAELIDALPDDVLAQMGERDLTGSWHRTYARDEVLDRFAMAGVAARAVFARWMFRCEPRTRAWAYGLDPDQDERTRHLSRQDAGLRRLIAAPVPLPVRDPVAALRAARDPFESEAVLVALTGDGDALPWPELVAAHRERPWPDHVLCVLTDRKDLPGPLAGALADDLLERAAATSPAAARLVLPALGLQRDPSGTLRRIHRGEVLGDEEILSECRPAGRLIRYLTWYSCELTGRRARLRELVVREVETAARAAPAGFWTVLLRLLDGFEGTLPELLTTTTARTRLPPTS